MMRCNDARLERLLAADESSTEYQSTANHVEGCSRCQHRLAHLSGDNDLRVEVQDTLRVAVETEPYRAPGSSSVVISVESGANDDLCAECEPVSLDVLAPPSHPEMPFLVMQYVPGQSLQARVDERGPLDPKEVLRIAMQAAVGLAAAHAQGLVHRQQRCCKCPLATLPEQLSRPIRECRQRLLRTPDLWAG